MNPACDFSGHIFEADAHDLEFWVVRIWPDDLRDIVGTVANHYGGGSQVHFCSEDSAREVARWEFKANRFSALQYLGDEVRVSGKLRAQIVQPHWKCLSIDEVPGEFDLECVLFGDATRERNIRSQVGRDLAVRLGLTGDRSTTSRRRALPKTRIAQSP